MSLFAKISEAIRKFIAGANLPVTKPTIVNRIQRRRNAKLNRR